MELKPLICAIAVFAWITSMLAIDFFMDTKNPLTGFLMFTDFIGITFSVLAYFAIKDYLNK